MFNLNLNFGKLLEIVKIYFNYNLCCYLFKATLYFSLHLKFNFINSKKFAFIIGYLCIFFNFFYSCRYCLKLYQNYFLNSFHSIKINLCHLVEPYITAVINIIIIIDFIKIKPVIAIKIIITTVIVVIAIIIIAVITVVIVVVSNIHL
jgi:hypothetical protein